MRKQFGLIVAFTLFFACTAFAATTPVTQIFEDNYRFGDVASTYGASQWVVITSTGSTAGGLGANPLFARANFVNKRDHVYLLRSSDLAVTTAVAQKEIGTLFFVMSGPSASFNIDFGWLLPSSSDRGLTQNILVEHGAFNCESSQAAVYEEAAVKSPDTPVKSPDVPVKSPDVSVKSPDKSPDVKPVAVASPATSQRWNFKFVKKSGADAAYETLRGNIIFQQSTASMPVQTLQIPFVIANVCNDSAQKKPLLFKMILRDSFSASKGGIGNIAASSVFEWDVESDHSTANDADWILVPAKKEPYASNVPPFQLETRITNYSGVRYALQRYDRTPLLNARWALDIDEKEADIAPNIVLDELSHIPPGLTTIYSQAYDPASSATSGVFQLYPVPQGKTAKVFRNLSFSCNNILKGIEVATESGINSTVTAFSLIPGSSDFLKRVAAEMNVPKVGILASESKFSGKILSSDVVGGEAVSVAAVNAKVPANLMASGDTRGLLPVQVTFNLPKSNTVVSKKWSELQTEWKKSGDIKELFSKYFTVNIRNPKWDNSDLFKWLKSNKSFEKNVKVFMDEERGQIAVSFIAILMDGDSPKLGLLNDKSTTSDYNYILINDGNKNDMWNLTFYCLPLESSSGTASAGPAGATGTGGSSSGGGGCNAGFLTLSSVLLGAALVFLKKR